MDRHSIGYLLIAFLAVTIAGLIARARYHSRDNVLRRQRRENRSKRQRRPEQKDKWGGPGAPGA